MQKALKPSIHSSTASRLLCLLSITLGLLFSGCSHLHKHGHEHESHAENAHHESRSLLINSDQKWLMDEHTRNVLADMQDRTFNLQADQLSTAERRHLGETLDQDLQKLIQGCTMQGAAHDALHQYLSELMPAVSALKSEGGQQEAERVQSLLSHYQDYFE